MKSLKARFGKLQLKNPYWSSHTVFATAVAGQNFNKTVIKRNFNKLVDNNDYAPEDKKAALGYLETL